MSHCVAHTSPPALLERLVAGARSPRLRQVVATASPWRAVAHKTAALTRAMGDAAAKLLPLQQLGGSTARLQALQQLHTSLCLHPLPALHVFTPRPSLLTPHCPRMPEPCALLQQQQPENVEPPAVEIAVSGLWVVGCCLWFVV